MKALTLATVMALLCGACATAKEPTGQLASATAAVRAAQELGAPEVPQAKLHLRLAQEQIEHAQKLILDDEMEEADLCLKRATADAELALAIARADVARDDALEAERKVSPEATRATAPRSDVQALRE